MNSDIKNITQEQKQDCDEEKTCRLISRFNASAFWFECDKCGGNSLHNYNYCPHCGRKVIKNER